MLLQIDQCARSSYLERVQDAAAKVTVTARADHQLECELVGPRLHALGEMLQVRVNGTCRHSTDRRHEQQTSCKVMLRRGAFEPCCVTIMQRLVLAALRALPICAQEAAYGEEDEDAGVASTSSEAHMMDSDQAGRTSARHGHTFEELADQVQARNTCSGAP